MAIACLLGAVSAGLRGIAREIKGIAHDCNPDRAGRAKPVARPEKFLKKP
jgi:hypothetical protein